MDTSGSRKGLILALACTAQFMVVLDIAIVNVALPAIQRELGMAQSALQWVVIAYGLLLGGFLLLGGRLGICWEGAGSSWSGWRCSRVRRFWQAWPSRTPS